MRTTHTLITTTGLLVLLGCAPSNERATLGEVVAMEALAMTPTRPEGTRDDQGSLTGLSRANWGRQAFLVPVDGTAGNTTYATSFSMIDDTARQRGQFPTAISALDTNDGFTAMQWAEAGASAPMAAWDFVLMGPRMFRSAPWHEVRGPRDSYWRATPTTLRTHTSSVDPAGAP
ncbi:MAG: hypothetical protein IPM33_12685 [Phycisphaerales bacterium]|nr:hypothetical protein [Phycisphaerales bacterium]